MTATTILFGKRAAVDANWVLRTYFVAVIVRNLGLVATIEFEPELRSYTMFRVLFTHQTAWEVALGLVAVLAVGAFCRPGGVYARMALIVSMAVNVAAGTTFIVSGVFAPIVVLFVFAASVDAGAAIIPHVPASLVKALRSGGARPRAVRRPS